MRKRHLVGVLLAGSVAVSFAQQLPPPSFKAGVQLVRIDVTGLDDKRQPVRGLQASDFTVLVDGQPRPIRAFQPVDRATAAAAPRGPAGPPARRRRRPPGAGVCRRCPLTKPPPIAPATTRAGSFSS